MAHMPNEVVVHITQAELAGQLEALAEQYEEVVNTLRWQAENLRQGFDLTLDVRATQVQMKPTQLGEEPVEPGDWEHDDPRHADEQNPSAEELDGDISDEEVKEALEPDVQWLMNPETK